MKDVLEFAGMIFFILVAVVVIMFVIGIIQSPNYEDGLNLGRIQVSNGQWLCELEPDDLGENKWQCHEVEE